MSKKTNKKARVTHLAKLLTPKTTNEILSDEIGMLIKELRDSNSLRRKLIGALLTGFGTVIGATLLVAILIFILTQLASIEVLRPLVESIVNMVKTSYR